MSGYVVGVDGSGPSVAALVWAMSRAAQLSSGVRLIHVIEDEWGLVGGDFVKEAIVAGKTVITEAEERANALVPSVAVTTEILHGSPVWELSHACNVDDVLVVGTHKTGYLHGRVLGSRSVSIAALAICTVIVVPNDASRGRSGIVVGVAGAGLSLRALSCAAREAARLHQPLILIHASSATPPAATDAVLLREAQRAVLNQAAQVVCRVAPEVVVHTRISTRSPAEALLDASQTAALLVLEPSREQDLARNLLGSTTHDVLMNINVPVLIARSDAI